MLESLGPIAGFGLVVVAFVLSWRRRAKMTPEQRAIADLKRKTRKLEREQDRHRYD